MMRRAFLEALLGSTSITFNAVSKKSLFTQLNILWAKDSGLLEMMNSSLQGVFFTAKKFV